MGRAAQLDEVKLKMQDTLVNHKRDVLVQHKVQSTAIQSDLEVLEKQKAKKSLRVKNLMDDMGMLKGSLTDYRKRNPRNHQTQCPQQWWGGQRGVTPEETETGQGL